LYINYTSFQNRIDLSAPHEIKGDSTGECSSQRGAPTWLEGHLATISLVITSQITTAKYTSFLIQNPFYKANITKHLTAKQTSLFSSSMDRINFSVALKIACIETHNGNY
jgi:hypothetical protein